MTQVKRWKVCRTSCDVGEVTERLENELCYDYNYELCSFTNLSVTSPTSQLILQPFRCFTYVTTHSPILPSSIYLRHSSFSNSSVASPTSHLILQPFFRFSYVTGPSLMSQLILQHFRQFTYVTAHSLTLPSLYLRHSSFSNTFVASPTSQLILQPFRCFTYVTARSLTLLSVLLRHRLFTYVT